MDGYGTSLPALSRFARVLSMLGVAAVGTGGVLVAARRGPLCQWSIGVSTCCYPTISDGARSVDFTATGQGRMR